MANRLKGRYGYDENEPFKVTWHPDRLLLPTTFKNPMKIFVDSMGDFFDPQVPELWQILVLDVIFHCPQHTFQILTKQPQNIPRWEEAEAHWPSNIWLGVSVDGKTTHQQHIDDLFEADFPHLRFVSFEPLLGPIEDLDLECMQWIIIGAQTGPGARQPKREWYEPIVKEAIDNNIPLFVKNNLQWAQWPKIWGFPRPHEFPEAVH
jgi:protein gp37